MWIRIWYGALRVILGLALLKYIGQPFSGAIFWLMAHEFAGKHDFLIHILKPMASNMHYGVTIFAAFYLLFWGVLDIVLSLCLLKNRMWAYPLSLVLISCFMTYELFRFFHTNSLAMVGLIVYDLMALWLIWREYKKIAVTNKILAPWET
jgi:uncharacterized membrane protein